MSSLSVPVPAVRASARPAHRLATVAAPLVIGGVLLAACAAPSSTSTGRTGAAATEALVIDPGGLRAPRSWRGELPCADCAGLVTTMTLRPDGTYQRDAAWLGTGGAGDTVAVDVGRWQWDPDTRRIRLIGSSDAPAWFAMGADGHLTQLDLLGQPITSALSYDLTPLAGADRSRHPARLVLAVRYLADAADGTECRSGLTHPVAMTTEAYRQVERAAVRAERRGAPLIVRVRAHDDEAPLGEGDSLVTAWVLDSLLAVAPVTEDVTDACATLRAQAAIAATGWRLVHLEGDSAPLTIPADVRADVTWDRADGRFVGSSGCNRFSAPGTLRGARLAAGPALGTKRACTSLEATEVEQRVLALLGAGPWVELDGDTLRWAIGPREVARFVAAPASAPQ